MKPIQRSMLERQRLKELRDLYIALLKHGDRVDRVECIDGDTFRVVTMYWGYGDMFDSTDWGDWDVQEDYYTLKPSYYEAEDEETI